MSISTDLHIASASMCSWLLSYSALFHANLDPKSNQPILRRICILILNTKSMCSKAMKQKAYPLHRNRIWCTVCRSYGVPKFRFDGFSHIKIYTRTRKINACILYTAYCLDIDSDNNRQWVWWAWASRFILHSHCMIKHSNENRDASFWVVLCENINARNGKRQLILKVPMQCMLYVYKGAFM